MNRNTIIEFLNSISEDDLRFLNVRLTERIGDDLGEALDFMSHFKSIDAVLSVARSANEVFDILDAITDVLQKECKRRGIQINDRK